MEYILKIYDPQYVRAVKVDGRWTTRECRTLVNECRGSLEECEEDALFYQEQGMETEIVEVK